MDFAEGSSVLFVGEGDYSFVASLSQNNFFNGVKVLASDLQIDLSERAKNNVDILQKQGVEVVVGVDATQLHKHPLIKYLKFSHVVFNFPHVGGKMKIHLNRRLLREFFESSVHVLDERGQIIVTLCGGQGGVSLDSVVRRWDDSWQVVLMAAYADLVLRSFEKFESVKHSGYSATGYRSMEKGFEVQGAFTYTFERNMLNSDSGYEALCMRDIQVNPNYSLTIPEHIFRQIKRNRFGDTSTPIGYFSSVVHQYFSTHMSLGFEKEFLVYEKCEECKVITEHYICNVDQRLLHKETLMYCAYRVNKICNFSLEPIIIIVGQGSTACLEQLLSTTYMYEFRNVSKSFHPEVKQFIWRDMLDSRYFNTEDISVHLKCTPSHMSACDIWIYTFRLTQIAKLCLDICPAELLSDGQCVRVSDGVVTYSSFCLFPIEYMYDLSFWESSVGQDERTECDLETVGIIIINTIKDALIDYRLMSTYVHPETKRKSYTYRITYMSFHGALSDDKAKQLHTQVGELLEEYLDVEVR